jgi:hypothetical protein
MSESSDPPAADAGKRISKKKTPGILLDAGRSLSGGG